MISVFAGVVKAVETAGKANHICFKMACRVDARFCDEELLILHTAADAISNTMIVSAKSIDNTHN